MYVNSIGSHSLYLIQSVSTKILSYFNKDDEKEMCREELEKVARFAKHHVPEQHEGDKAKYVEERINTLMQYQVATVLNVIATSESKKVQVVLRCGF